MSVNNIIVEVTEEGNEWKREEDTSVRRGRDRVKPEQGKRAGKGLNKGKVKGIEKYSCGKGVMILVT